MSPGGAWPAARAGLATLALALALGCEGAQEPDGTGDARPPSGGPATPGAPPAIRFEDATALAGLEFVHRNGAVGAKWLPETMGAGACLFDFDGDRILDVFFVNGTAWPETSETPGKCALFRGRGDGTFEDVSRASGADVEVYGMGCAAGDYDGDGDLDLYVTTLTDDLLLRNDGGSFVDVAGAAGVGAGRWRDADGEHPEWTTACLWLDADVDGWLDLFVAGYCQWRPRIEIFTSLDGVAKAFTTPDRYVGLPCRLYRNRHDGTFEELPFEDEEPPVGKGLGAATWDLDGDGRPEILVANDTRPNFLFQSTGDGRLRERAAEVGLAYDLNGRARAGMGIDVAELNGAAPVVAIGNFADEELSFSRRLPNGTFRSEAAHVGLAEPTLRPLAFGLALLDLDLDGWLDLVVANGHIEPDIADFRPGQAHAQSPQLFLGGPEGRFREVSDAVGPAFQEPRVGRSMVWGDVDGDGDLDLLFTQNAGPPALLLNRVRETAAPHFLRVDLVGRDGNRAALGARVELTAGGRTQVRTVRTGSSYLGHGETTLTFGLGPLTRVERLEVRWPRGARTRHDVEGVDRTVRLHEE